MRAKSNAPIIIKRKKVVADGVHHGGAWKVAICISFGRMTLLRQIELFALVGVSDVILTFTEVRRFAGRATPRDA